MDYYILNFLRILELPQRAEYVFRAPRFNSAAGDVHVLHTKSRHDLRKRQTQAFHAILIYLNPYLPLSHAGYIYGANPVYLLNHALQIINYIFERLLWQVSIHHHVEHGEHVAGIY